MKNVKKLLHYMVPFFIFLVLALVLIAYPLINKQTYLGVDSLFHYNRFFDTAMQIKHHQISYFQSNYGFLQNGRMLNALYGPVVAYIGGFLLLICGTWFKFQIVTDLIVLIVAALGMYKLCRVNEVAKKPAIFMGFLYMYSSTIVQWVTSQQFTAFGAALMPFLMIYATSMVRRHDVSVWGLAITMSILVQTHLMSSVIGALGLISFFIVGLVTAEDKAQRLRMFLHTFYAALITIVLTINVWFNLLMVSNANRLLPVYPVPSVRTHGYNFNPYSLLNILKPTEFLLFVGVLILVFKNFRKLDRLTKTLACTGLGFLVIAWSHFPWTALEHVMPSLNYTLQFPKRFLVLAFIFLLLTFGKFLTSEINADKHPYAKLIKAAVVVLIMGSAGLDFYSIHQRSESYVALQTKHHRNNANQNSLYYYFKKHHRSVQKDTQSHHLNYLMKDYVKATPDYLPVKKTIKSNKKYEKFNPYRRYYRDFIHPNHANRYFDRTVKADGSLQVAWYAGRAGKIQLPLVKYADTQVKYNGKVLKHVKTTSLGAIKSKSKLGLNRVSVRYMPSFTTRLMMVITWVAWIVFVAWGLLRKIKFN